MWRSLMKYVGHLYALKKYKGGMVYLLATEIEVGRNIIWTNVFQGRLCNIEDQIVRWGSVMSPCEEA